MYSEEVISPSNPMALRLSASLMVGIVRIHRQQAHYTYSESGTAFRGEETCMY